MIGVGVTELPEVGAKLVDGGAITVGGRLIVDVEVVDTTVGEESVVGVVGGDGVVVVDGILVVDGVVVVGVVLVVDVWVVGGGGMVVERGEEPDPVRRLVTVPATPLHVSPFGQHAFGMQYWPFGQ